MHIAAYIRVSTDEQADKGNSLTEQKERLIAYCKAMGWNEPTFYQDDGYSAKDLNRPAMQRLIADIKEYKYDIVLTSKLDRLTRSLLDLLNTINLFDEYKCHYVSASESFDTSTAVGRMVLQLLGVFAEFERERIRERVKENMLSIAKNTTKAITRPCFGYDIIDGRYTINKQEAEFVKLMFELAEDGHGPRKIAQILNEKGCKTKLGKSWDMTNVKRLMTNETVMGTMIYNKRENKNGKMRMRDQSEWIIKEDNHPAIISKEQFEKVQTIFKSRSKANKHADNETYLLTGLVVCKHCGRNMKGNTRRHKTKWGNYTYFKYLCASYQLGYGCKHHQVDRDELENKIIERIKELASNSVNDINIKISNSYTDLDEINSIKEQLSRIDKRMQKQIEAYENDLISAHDLKQARIRIENERQELLERLEKLANKKGNVSDVQQKASNLLDDITGLDRVKAKAAIRKLIDKIEIENGNLISILWLS